MYGKLKEFLTNELEGIKAAGLYKNERIITTPQRADIKVNAGSDVLNFCANNYLGLSDNQRLIKAAKEAMDTHGYGMSSVRFICGTQDLHKQLEAAISDYFKTEDTILYAACFDANGGLFEPLFGEEDAIISDALNHASIIDGVRLCKAKRYRYANADMADLERCLQEAQAQRHRIIATDGVFSMDGNVAPMDKICELAEKYDALVMVDESHSAGVVGPTGHGVAEQFDVYGRVDIFTGTLGKAFGGAMGGFDRKEGDYRYVTPTFSPLLVLQLRGSGHRRRKLGDVQDVEGERRFTYEINEQRKLLPRQDAGSRFRYQADSIRYLRRYVVRR